MFEKQKRRFETTIQNIDTGEVISFESLSAAATRMNACKSTVRKAYLKGDIIRSRNGSVWKIVRIND